VVLFSAQQFFLKTLLDHEGHQSRKAIPVSLVSVTLRQVWKGPTDRSGALDSGRSSIIL
jgi:hypothetical protein